MDDLITQVSAFIGWSYDNSVLYSVAAPKSYKRYMIPKKKGGKRVIYHPAKKTKALQYGIINILLSKIKVHKIAAAYIPGKKSPILNNAILHKKYNYSVRIDFTDFFPSIKPKDLITIVNKIVSENDLIGRRPNGLFENEKYFIEKALFVDHHIFGKHLAIGSPASPIISNIVMYDIDECFHQYSKKNRAAVSRYADDIIYSTNRKGDCKKFLDFSEKTLRQTKSPSLKINQKKTIFMSRKNRKAITGLIITPEGNISVGRKQKRYIRKLIWENSRDNLEEKEFNYLRGYLSYLMDVEPEYINKLVLKYGHEAMTKVLKPS